MASNHGRITITQGQYTEACTTQNDLLVAQAQYPEIRKEMEYANRRALTTLLVSGVVTPYGIDNTQETKIPEAGSKGTAIGNNGYQFRIMGRIEKPSVILSQIGSTSADGSFTLKMGDRHLNKGMVCMFNGGRFMAAVVSQPRGNSSSGFIYDFQAPSGDLFVYATHVGGQAGVKTCMGAYTSFGEGSLKGYGDSKFPDMFINHTTTQRSTVGITGDAASAVLWYKFNLSNGAAVNGWMFEETNQQNVKFIMENERQKFFGVSSMKNADGSLRAYSRRTDPETGLYIVEGDGIEEQIAGGNVLYGSGSGGQPTIQDYADMNKTLEKKGDKVSGFEFIYVTGTDGYANFQTEAVNLAGNQNITFMDNITQDNKVGGPTVDVGYKFGKVNIAGNSGLIVKHPMFDDDLMFTERMSDNSGIKMSSTVFVLCNNNTTQKNMEMFYKSANGVNRSDVRAKLNGMTGSTETVLTEEDKMKFALLKQDMICIFNTQIFGIIYPGS